MSYTLNLPKDAAFLVEQLRNAGYTAYVVGGCVRDSVLGRTPGDWDLCTSALPAQTRQVFAGHKMILTGEKHGTVAVVLHGQPYEITTYRVEGAYSDHRRPDAVRFVPDVREDLARRDFTVNAMAYAPEEGLVDAFGGQADLQNKIIRCVGDPYQRFAEDALRILRAVRFAAQLGFTLEPATEQAALALRETVQSVSVERIYTELDKLLAGPAAGMALHRYGRILAGAIPEIEPCIGCTQPGRWHCYDVWQHSAMAVERLSTAGQDENGARVLRWAAFLHDIAKPLCRTEDSLGAHFHGHNQRGGKLCRTILQRLKAPAYLIEGASGLVAVHDMARPEGDAETLRLLNRFGPTFLLRLCLLKYADLDAHAQTPAVAERRAVVAEFEQDVKRLAQTGCYTIPMLAVNGGDMMELGLRPGPRVGEMLHQLLEEVMAGSLPNERTALLRAAKEILRRKA